ncbi:thioesterase II family protein [Streptomyces flavofungini]|uniref:thioesterase II family protein n=1 Tax=Streptomyces flavofungini TaxID=68200 RepID=UPI0034DF189D
MTTALSTAIRPRPVEDPALRLFVLHHAGGSHVIYTHWVTHFPADWDICLLEAPGRGPLSALPAHEDCAGLAAFLLDGVQTLLDAPIALFGHSMGALVAYEMTRQLIERGQEQPVWLGISSCEDPFTEQPPFGGELPLHLMTSTGLRDALAAMGGLPTAILEDDTIWQLYEPRLRADFKLVETWRPRPADRSRIPVPCSLFGGESDHVVTRDQLLAWNQGMDHPLGEHFFPGAHFYFDQQAPLIAAQITEEIDTAAPGLAGW